MLKRKVCECVYLSGSIGRCIGYDDPIWPTKEDTDSSYHRVVGVMTEQIKAGKANLMVATQNEISVQFALNR